MDLTKMATTPVYAVLGFVITLLVLGALAPTLTDAFTNFSGSGLPLASLFSSSGIIATIFVIAVFIGLVTYAFSSWKKK